MVDKAKVIDLGVMRAMNNMISRSWLGRALGQTHHGKRDLYEVFGYKKRLKSDDFLMKYARDGIAGRVVDAPPDATWARPPCIKGSLEEEFKTLALKHNIWSTVLLADKLSRMNKYAVILLGFKGNFKNPAQSSEELMYMRAFGSRYVESIDYVEDVNNPRFGMPETYNINFQTDRNADGHTSTARDQGKSIPVHYTRVVHVVENALEDRVHGIPTLEKVHNILDDLEKVRGGTAEAYWMASNRGMQVNVDKEMELDDADMTALEDEIDEYQHELRRVIRTRGVEINSLGGTIQSPKDPYSMLVATLSGATGIPQRILIGAEAGQLASAQDRANWADRISERRVLHAEPTILEPLVRRLQAVGILSEATEELEWEWPPAFILSPLELGQTAAQHARAIGNISRQMGNNTPMQIVSEEEARNIIGLQGTIDDADRIEVNPPPTTTDPGNSSSTQTGETKAPPGQGEEDDD